jgi:hypothetical protein
MLQEGDSLILVSRPGRVTAMLEKLT